MNSEALPWQSQVKHDLRIHLVAQTNHLAIFGEPYLSLVRTGKKTIESRFSANRCSPYGVVRVGDRIFVKGSSGPVCGYCDVTKVQYYELTSVVLEQIQKEFGEGIGVQDPQFWEDKKRARYATLIWIDGFTALDPVECGKKDRRGWVVL